MAYSFTAPDIMKALVAAKKRGVDVKIVIDERGNTGRASIAAMNYIANSGIPLRRGLRANDVKNHVNRLTYCFILIIRCCIYSYSNDHGADGRWNAIPSRLIA